MEAVVLTDLSKMVDVATELVEVFLTAIREHTRSAGSEVLPNTEALFELEGRGSPNPSGGLSVWEVRPKASARHSLETKGQNAFVETRLDEVVSVIKGGASSRAIVIDIGNGDTRHAELVKRSLEFCQPWCECASSVQYAHLAGGRVAVAIPNIGCFDCAVREACKTDSVNIMRCTP